jgi:hypothetical protein
MEDGPGVKGKADGEFEFAEGQFGWAASQASGCACSQRDGQRPFRFRDFGLARAGVRLGRAIGGLAVPT